MTLLDALRGARVYDLEQPRYAGAPVWPTHEPGVLLNLHRRHEQDAFEGRTSRLGAARHDRALRHAHGRALPPGLRRRDARGRGGDRGRADAAGFTALGIDTVAPIVARGVLLDVAGACRACTAADLEATGVEVRPGDVALVRLGSGALWSDRAAYLARAA